MNDINDKHSRAITVWMFVVFALPCVIFAQTLTFDFINLNDDVSVYNNPNVSNGISANTVQWAFSAPRFGNYQPLTWVSHMLDVQWFGLAPGRHHGVNLLLHALNGVLLLLLLRGWTGALGKSAVVALLFAAHPLHVESVAWISGRDEVLGTFLLLLTLGTYTQYVRSPSRRTYVAVMALFVLTLLAKPAWIVLPVLLLLIDFWPLGRFQADRGRWANVRPLLLEKAPLIAVVLAMVSLTFAVTRQAGESIWGTPYPPMARATNALLAYAIHLGQALWPAKLIPFYPHAGIEPSWPAIGAAAATLLLATVAAVRYCASFPFVFVGWCWFMVSLLPSAGIVRAHLYGQADRSTYVPLIGIFVLAVWGAPRIAERWSLRQRTMTGIAVAIVGLFALMSYVQAGHWRNSEVLWRYTINVAPENALAYQKLGTFYFDRGKWAESEAALLKAIELSASDPHVHAVIGGPSLNALGIVATELGQLDRAVEYYARAVEMFPGDARIRSNYGEALLAVGKLDDAVRELRRAVEMDARLASAWNSLAFAFVIQRKIDDARDAGTHAVALEPRNPEFWYHLALAEFAAERNDPALKLLEKVFALDGGFEAALALKTEILARRGVDPADLPRLNEP